ncbi:glycine cleavage T C-terminal barrel domain-containing protein [Labrys wisconsinensis]|uniref:Sarcosine oxidase subunit alpha n=1 Tax=Labrys wisconsinensis TaxID=425677 RepID=A0ABU0J129_9HYPH|nr:glycine cleavage T C-terminal barrel domain-containing protein [Labrys wisconsinensis]MDQ0467966.1 sarcosine oxidase subunit alpha [Labrys wisconsinensis]
MSASAAPRLGPDGWGLLIDRARPVSFTFDGVACHGYRGDVIASALVGSGRWLMSRSFKYHRPRGPLTMAGHDVNALVQVGPEPNVRGDRHPIAQDMAAVSVNHFGSLDGDWYAVLERFGRFLPVGFYYKTFFRPNGSWKLFEKPIRALAGLGKLDPKAHHGHYDKAYLFCDVLVAGGGPAGLEAAIAAAEAGAETLLIDEWPELGGSLLHGRGGAGRAATDARRAALVARARALPGLTILGDTTVSGLFADNWASAISGNRLYKIRARETVLATGAFDQPLVFRNNDRPGILFADAAQRLMRLYGVRPGRRAVIATANRFGYEAALDLLDAGVEVAAIVDLNPSGDGEAAAEARARGLRIIAGSTLVEARGKVRVEAVAVAAIAGEGRTAGSPEWIGCDTVLMSVGYTPALNLASHAGAKVIYDPAIAMHRAVDLPPGVTLVGAAAGLWSEETVSADARAAGVRVAAAALDRPAAASALTADPGAARITHPWPIFSDPKAKDFVDFDEDLQTKDIVHSVQDGYDDIQLVKRYSTAGLGPSQGRHANLNTIRLVAKETGRSIAAVGTTTFRPPLVPEKFGHMAGRAFEPVRHTAMHHRHLELGAQMMPAGLWLRPAYYGRKGASADAIEAEVRAVREGVGMIDVSTLGGLDIRGPDAAELVDRMYTWAYAKQPVGRARYALMTDQTGVVIDDGVACRFHERHYYLTATTGAVDQVYRQMTWWNTQWRLDVDIANVTAAYAGVNLAGPKAREALAGLETDIDFSAEAFPYMAVRQGRLAGIPVRVLRVGFVGELGYEIHCPSGLGEALWDRLFEAGQPFGLRPFGVEAQRVLRLEKGHIIVGQDTDGLTNPAEAGMEWALAKKKPFYVGKRAVEMQMGKGVTRRLVGFALADPAAPCPKECHLVIRDGDIAGRVTSAVRSPSLDKVVGLAYVPSDLAAPGSRFEIRIEGGRMIGAEVVATPFYDPENKRQEL